MKHTNCPSGIPDFLFNHPEYFDAVQLGKPVDLHAVTLCKDVHLYQRNEFGSEDIFSEWALNVMVEKEWRLPNTFNEAYDLFSELILIIYAMEN